MNYFYQLHRKRNLFYPNNKHIIVIRNFLLSISMLLYSAFAFSQATNWVQLSGGNAGATNSGVVRSLAWDWTPGGVPVTGTVDISRVGAGNHYVFSEKHQTTITNAGYPASNYVNTSTSYAIGNYNNTNHFGSSGELPPAANDVAAGAVSTTVIDFKMTPGLKSPKETYLSLFDPGGGENGVFGPFNYKFEAYLNGNLINTSTWTIQVEDVYSPYGVNTAKYTWNASTATFNVSTFPIGTKPVLSYNFPDTIVVIDTNNTIFDRLVVTVVGMAVDTMGIGIGSARAPSIDSDNDGMTDEDDIDDDNDGIKDLDESGVAGVDPSADADGDLIQNYKDPSFPGFVDANGDGINDNFDKDRDGVPNSLDLDSDNDGLLDIFESLFYVNNIDPDGDGRIGIFTAPFADADKDGLGDIMDPNTTAGAANFANPNYFGNRDGDALKNQFDIDADNDGIVDNIEGQSTLGYKLPTGLDTDKDGVDDAYDINNGGASIGYINTDGGSSPDYVDTDAENDGLSDLKENAKGVSGSLDPSEVDLNNDGILDLSAYTDADNDGLADIFDLINGISTANNVRNNQTPTGTVPNGMPNTQAAGTPERDWREKGDNDYDGIPNITDLDSDNDGIPDSVEGYGDDDNDGHPNYLDLDADNDGIYDVIEAGGVDPDHDGWYGTTLAGVVAIDANGLPAALSGTGLVPGDFDGDGKPDYLDLDSDNDGIYDVIEVGGSDANNDGVVGPAVLLDADADGIIDAADVYNNINHSAIGGTYLNLINTDGDATPNYKDYDSDGDGCTDANEFYRTVTADGNDGAKYGVGNPAVNAIGKVVAASYMVSSYANVTNNTVSAACQIDAINDDFTATPLNVGGSTVSVVNNDVNDITPLVAGAGFGQVTVTGVTVPSQLTLNPDGTITVNPGTPTGNYSLTYRICVNGITPLLCDDATATVRVQIPIVANIDDYTSTPLQSGQSTPPVITNDTYNSNPAVIGTSVGQVTLTPLNVPSQLTLNPDGTITVNPGTPSGTYALDYRICESATVPASSNCDATTATVVVQNTIDAVDNTYPVQTPKTTPTNLGSVIGNDTLGSGAATTANTDVTPITTGPLSIDADGNLTLAANTAPGTYTITYQLCEAGSTTNCDTAIATVVVAADNDKDGVPDNIDIDDDNDGIKDLDESGVTGVDPSADADSDGIPNYKDATFPGFVDANSDGVNDLFDKDRDGIPNIFDIDADNDGLMDIWESLFYVQNIDPDGDGRVDTPTTFADADGDGLGDVMDPDTPTGATNFGNASYFGDRDGDGIKNQFDIDADNDGIVDNIEGQPTLGYLTPTGLDTDGDGLDNAYDVNQGGTPAGYVNSDGGSAPDYVDTDAENDGIKDLAENALGVSGSLDPSEVDLDNNGILDLSAYTDADNDGLADIFDLVNGISAANNVRNNQTPTGTLPNGMPNVQNASTPERDWRESTDTDEDGVPDALDIDDDNDGITDLVEGTGDNDNDGEPNYLDLDSDNDGIYDVIEAGGSDPDFDGHPGTTAGSNPAVYPSSDPTRPGLPSTIPAPLVPTDFDSDGKPNYLDLDSDNDGVHDVIEAGGTDANNDGQVGPAGFIDFDADGINDYADVYNNLTNAPFVVGATVPGVALSTTNTDGTGNPNYLDLDSDDDGCSDSNEYYGTRSADGFDAGQYGVGPDPVPTNTNGTVVAASYSGSYANAINSSVHTACEIDAIDDGSTPSPFATVPFSTSATVLSNSVINNDTVNGVPATTSNTNVTPTTSGNLSIDADGIITVAANTPAGDYSINYTLCEQLVSGVPLCDNATAYVKVNAPTNTNPVANPNTNSTNEDVTLTVTDGAAGDILLDDTDPENDLLSVTKFEINSNSYPAGTTVTIPEGQVTINSDGSYTYIPTAGYNGTLPVITYTIDDGNGGTAYSTLTITVNPVNNPPVLDDDNVTIPEDTIATGDLTDAGDSDPDGTTLTVNPVPVSGPSHGSIVINQDGTYTYTPFANYNGPDIVVVQICDNGIPLPPACANQTLNITVTPVNDPPVADDAIQNTPLVENGTGGSINILTHVTDPDGNPVPPSTFSVDLDLGTSGEQHTITTPEGTWNYVIATGMVNFTPAFGFTGVATLPYTICDNGTPNMCSTANITFSVNSENVTNTCPDNFVNLITAFTPTNLPAGTTLSWHTDTPATTANMLTPAQASNITASGTYYAAFYDSVFGCFSPTTIVQVNIVQCACYNDANKSVLGTDTNHGITLLQRAGSDNGNWPMLRKSAYTVLESNTKGFVVTRMTTVQINALTAQEGMMVYDTDLKCLKIYDGTVWSCFNTPACP